MNQSTERTPAQFFFEVGFGACWAEAYIRAGETPPFPLTSDVVKRAWMIAPEAHDDYEEFDLYLERANGPTLTEAPEPLVEKVARAIGKVLGLDLDEVCGITEDAGECDSSTCPGALTEDHDAEDSRETLFRMARAALSSITTTEAEADVVRNYNGWYARVPGPGEDQGPFATMEDAARAVALIRWNSLPADERSGERPYIMGWNDGYEHAALTTTEEAPPAVDHLIHSSMSRDFERRSNLSEDSGEVVQADIDAATRWLGAASPVSIDRLAKQFRDHRIASQPSVEREKVLLRDALEQAEETLDQILDDMRGDGRCVCLAVKNEAVETLAMVRTALATPVVGVGDED